MIKIFILLVGYGAVAFNHVVTAKLPKNVLESVLLDILIYFYLEMSDSNS